MAFKERILCDFYFLAVSWIKKNAYCEFGNEILFAIKMYLYFALIKTNILLNNCRRWNIDMVYIHVQMYVLDLYYILLFLAFIMI